MLKKSQNRLIFFTQKKISNQMLIVKMTFKSEYYHFLLTKT